MNNYFLLCIFTKYFKNIPKQKNSGNPKFLSAQEICTDIPPSFKCIYTNTTSR